MRISRITESYGRAGRDNPLSGITCNSRPEPTLEEARSELAKAIGKVAKSVFQDFYGPVFTVLTEQAIEQQLREFEMTISTKVGDMTLVLEEVFDRMAFGFRCDSK